MSLALDELFELEGGQRMISNGLFANPGETNTPSATVAAPVSNVGLTPLQVNTPVVPGPTDADKEGVTTTTEEGVEEESQEEEESAQAQDSAGTAAANPAAIATAPKPTRAKRSARDEEPYEWEQCTVVLTIQFLPLRKDEPSQQRRIIVAAQAHSDPPFYKLLTLAELGTLPQAAADVLEQLRAALPAQAEQRKAVEAGHQQAAQAKALTHAKGTKKEKNKATPSGPAAEGGSTPAGAPEATKSAPANKASKKKKFDLDALPVLPGFGAALPTEQSGTVQH